MKPAIIMNADDYGFSPGTNEGIQEAFEKGILTSASIMPTGPLFNKAVQYAKKNRKMGIGIHLSLTLGTSVLPHSKISDLVDRDSYFYPSYGNLMLKAVTNRSIRKQIYDELETQIKKVIKNGITPDHLNSQYHTHMIPFIFQTVVSLSKRYKIPFVRVPQEQLHTVTEPISMIKWGYLACMSNCYKITNTLPESYTKFYGILYTRNVTKEHLLALLQRATQETGDVEILTHPARIDLNVNGFDYKRQRIYEFLTSPDRIQELDALCDKEVITYVKKNNIKLSTFAASRGTR